ncbi:MAG: Spy/CpxP family protein refolding chaperone [Chthonomonadales bacterium]
MPNSCRIRVLFLVMLIALAARGQAQRPPSEEERERVRIRIGMTREQQDQIEKLWMETDRKLKEIAQKMSDLRRQLFELYDTYDYDRVKAAALRRQIAALYAQRMAAFAENQEKLRRILNRDQFERLRALIHEDFEKRRQSWQGKRGYPPHGPSGPPPHPPGEHP